jgi:hypothetical protein
MSLGVSGFLDQDLDIPCVGVLASWSTYSPFLKGSHKPQRQHPIVRIILIPHCCFPSPLGYDIR